jgi:hypothetical protein
MNSKKKDELKNDLYLFIDECENIEFLQYIRMLFEYASLTENMYETHNVKSRLKVIIKNVESVDLLEIIYGLCKCFEKNTNQHYHASDTNILKTIDSINNFQILKKIHIQLTGQTESLSTLYRSVFTKLKQIQLTGVDILKCVHRLLIIITQSTKKKSLQIDYQKNISSDHVLSKIKQLLPMVTDLFLLHHLNHILLCIVETHVCHKAFSVEKTLNVLKTNIKQILKKHPYSRKIKGFVEEMKQHNDMLMNRCKETFKNNLNEMSNNRFLRCIKLMFLNTYEHLQWYVLFHEISSENLSVFIDDKIDSTTDLNMFDSFNYLIYAVQKNTV